MQLSKLPFALCLAASLSACVVDDGDTDTDAGTGTDPATTDTMSTTDPATTDTMSTTDPVTTDPVTTDASTSTDPATTDPGTSETSASETDVSTSVADSTGTDTGTVGGCGWDEASMFYACGGEGADPDGNFPLECGEAPVAGAECDENSPINGIGCCFEGGNAFCGKDGTVQIEECA